MSNRPLAANHITPVVEKQHTQYIQSIINAYTALIAPRLKAQYKMSDRELQSILLIGESGIRRANQRKEART